MRFNRQSLVRSLDGFASRGRAFIKIRSSSSRRKNSRMRTSRSSPSVHDPFVDALDRRRSIADAHDASMLAASTSTVRFMIIKFSFPSPLQSRTRVVARARARVVLDAAMTTPVAAYDALASGSDAFAPCCVPESDRAHIGYADADRAFVGDADLGLGCGAPVTRAMLAQGEAVLDLGSGGGADAFLAARAVGKFGRVTGVDASESMIRRARERARTMIDEGREEISAVEFRLGELESIPVESGTYDCVISNCVINLCGDKRRAFAEAFRALKPGGRLCVSDVLRRHPGDLPERLRTNEALAC